MKQAQWKMFRCGGYKVLFTLYVNVCRIMNLAGGGGPDLDPVKYPSECMIKSDGVR